MIKYVQYSERNELKWCRRACLKKEYYDDDYDDDYAEQIIRKYRFDRFLFCDFCRADDRWEVIVVLKSAAHCKCVSK